MTLVAEARSQSAEVRSQPAEARGWPRDSPTRQQSLISTGSLALVVGLLGAVSAVFAAVVSRHVWRPDELMLPWGMVLAVAGSVAVVVAARSRGKAQGSVAAAGWIVGLLLVLAGPGGDIVVAGDLRGYAFLLGATAAVLLTAGWPQQRA